MEWARTHMARVVDLTYPDNALFKQTDPKNYVRRLKRKFECSIKYFAVPELGSKGNLLHWHMILFCSKRIKQDDIESAWPYITYTRLVKHINQLTYRTKYMLKQTEVENMLDELGMKSDRLPRLKTSQLMGSPWRASRSEANPTVLHYPHLVCLDSKTNRQHTAYYHKRKLDTYFKDQCTDENQRTGLFVTAMPPSTWVSEYEGLSRPIQAIRINSDLEKLNPKLSFDPSIARYLDTAYPHVDIDPVVLGQHGLL